MREGRESIITGNIKDRSVNNIITESNLDNDS